DARDGSPLWSYQAASIPYVAAVGAGVIYAGTSGASPGQTTTPPDAVYALNAHDGSVRWRSQLKGFLLAASDDTLYLRTDRQHVAALGASDGSLRWQFQAATDVVSVHQHGGLVSVFAQAADQQAAGVLYVVNAASGTLRWRYPRAQTRTAPFLSLLARGTATIYLAEPVTPHRQTAQLV